MESVGVIAISGLAHDAAALARFTIARPERARRLPELAAALGVRELVYLATCNRVEVVYRERRERAGRDLRGPVLRALLGRAPQVGEAEALLRSWRGAAAAEHLFLVAAGLDSAQLGEREIQGQVREALAEARAAGTSGALVDSLLEAALRVARRVHARTQLGGGRVSLAEIAGELLLERVRRTPSAVALVGVSPMTRRCAEVLAREAVPVVVVNRTPAHAEALVAELGGGDVMTLEEFRQRPPRVEALLCSTAAPEPVLDRAALERLAAHTASQEPPLVVDLAVPPDVDPEVARLAQVPRVGLDEINRLAQAGHASRRQEAAAARAVVNEALVDFRRRLAERALAPVIARINQRYRETALEGVERLLTRRGSTIDAADREDLERWAETLARRFAHLPTLGLRGLAAGHGLDAVRSFLVACDGAAFAELCDAAAELETLSESLAPLELEEEDPEPRDRRR